MISAWAAGRRPAFQGAQSTVRSALDWCPLYLPVTHPMRDKARDYLLIWIWSQAERESFRDICRRRRWSRATAMRWIGWALDRIVDGLNEDAARSAAQEALDSDTNAARRAKSGRGIPEHAA